MILSDASIVDRVETENLIEPFKVENVQPASYDLTLDSNVVVQPQEFRLLSTVETVNIPPDLQGSIFGRSSLARMGLFVHISAGFVDPGFHGTLTLECYNAGSKAIALSKGDRIAQISFAELDEPAENPYAGRYQGQVGATGSKFYETK